MKKFLRHCSRRFFWNLRLCLNKSWLCIKMQRVSGFLSVGKKHFLVVTEVVLDKSEYREPKGSGTKICSTAIMVLKQKLRENCQWNMNGNKQYFFPYSNTTVFKIQSFFILISCMAVCSKMKVRWRINLVKKWSDSLV